MKYSKQREMIYQAVKEEAVHPTADMIYHRLKADNPNLSLGTVYRNLNQLCEQGMLLRVQAPFGAEHYDGRTDVHYHMQCSCCHRVFDIPVEALQDAAQVVERQTGHHITGQTVTFSGICKYCMDTSRS